MLKIAKDCASADRSDSLKLRTVNQAQFWQLKHEKVVHKTPKIYFIRDVDKLQISDACNWNHAVIVHEM